MKRFASIILGLASCIVATAQTNNVSTVVISADTGEPVSGASVVVTGSNIATTTDMNGKFSIDAPSEYKTLTVSYNNMQPAVVNILPDPIVMKKANGLASGWGVEFGLMSGKWNVDEEDDDIKGISSLTGGVTYDYPISSVPNLSVLGGLFLTTKGFKYDDEDEKYKATYLELQATAKYAYTLPVLNNDIKVFGLAGPYLAYGLFSSDIEYDYTEPSMFDFTKRFDAGLVLGIGAEYKRFSLTCRWGIGLMNIWDKDKAMETTMKDEYEYYKDKYDYSWDEFKNMYEKEYDSSDWDESVKNNSFMITVGYRF